MQLKEIIEKSNVPSTQFLSVVISYKTAVVSKLGYLHWYLL